MGAPGRRISGRPGVITGAQRYTQPLLVAGLGCNRGCPLVPLLALLDKTLARHGLQRSDLRPWPALN